MVQFMLPDYTVPRDLYACTRLPIARAYHRVARAMPHAHANLAFADVSAEFHDGVPLPAEHCLVSLTDHCEQIVSASASLRSKIEGKKEYHDHPRATAHCKPVDAGMYNLRYIITRYRVIYDACNRAYTRARICRWIQAARIKTFLIPKL